MIIISLQMTLEDGSIIELKNGSLESVELKVKEKCYIPYVPTLKDFDVSIKAFFENSIPDIILNHVSSVQFSNKS